MMVKAMKFIFPDYNKNIINVSSTFNEMLGNECNVPTLKVGGKINVKR